MSIALELLNPRTGFEYHLLQLPAAYVRKHDYGGTMISADGMPLYIYPLVRNTDDGKGSYYNDFLIRKISILRNEEDNYIHGQR